MRRGWRQSFNARSPASSMRYFNLVTSLSPTKVRQNQSGKQKTEHLSPPAAFAWRGFSDSIFRPPLVHRPARFATGAGFVLQYNHCLDGCSSNLNRPLPWQEFVLLMVRNYSECSNVQNTGNWKCTRKWVAASAVSNARTRHTTRPVSAY